MKRNNLSPLSASDWLVIFLLLLAISGGAYRYTHPELDNMGGIWGYLYSQRVS
jgi:hypothetical protein